MCPQNDITVDSSTPDPALRDRLDYDDHQLLNECEVHRHRVSGPGGQHRNKVATAIRLVHKPSAIVVTGTERRSQHENQTQALHRLREAIATHVRRPLPAQINWPPTVQIVDRRLRINDRNPALPQVIGLVLDAWHAAGGQPRAAADLLDISSSSLTRFLSAHPPAWAEANRIRAAAGLSSLKKT